MGGASSTRITAVAASAPGGISMPAPAIGVPASAVTAPPAGPTSPGSGGSSGPGRSSCMWVMPCLRGFGDLTTSFRSAGPPWPPASVIVRRHSPVAETSTFLSLWEDAVADGASAKSRGRSPVAVESVARRGSAPERRAAFTRKLTRDPASAKNTSSAGPPARSTSRAIFFGHFHLTPSR